MENFLFNLSRSLHKESHLAAALLLHHIVTMKLLVFIISVASFTNNRHISLSHLYNSFYFLIKKSSELNFTYRVALCGSASVSEYLWCTRWSLAQWSAQSWKAMVLNTVNKIRSGSVALYERCAHNRCAPAVIPRPDIKYKNRAKINQTKINCKIMLSTDKMMIIFEMFFFLLNSGSIKADKYFT